MKYRIDCSFCDNKPVDSNTVLDALAENRIVSIMPVVQGICSGKFRVREECDRYFEAYLTREQLAAFGKEIIAMAQEGGA